MKAFFARGVSILGALWASIFGTSVHFHVGSTMITSIFTYRQINKLIHTYSYTLVYMQRAILDFVEDFCFVYARSGAKNASIKWPDRATPL